MLPGKQPGYRKENAALGCRRAADADCLAHKIHHRIEKSDKQNFPNLLSLQIDFDDTRKDTDVYHHKRNQETPPKQCQRTGIPCRPLRENIVQSKQGFTPRRT